MTAHDDNLVSSRLEDGSFSDHQLLVGPELEPASGQKAKQLVVLLHGYGSDGDDLISLAPEFAESLPDAHFIAPNAPFHCEMAPYGFQWFSLQEYTQPAMLEKSQIAIPILNYFLDETLKRLNLTADNMALVGFSQGTMMSLLSATKRKPSCAGVLGYSGSFLDADPNPNQSWSSPPVCLIHGKLDPVVPFSSMKNAEHALKTIGIDVETHARPNLPHGIDAEGIEIGNNFLNRIFNS